MSRSIILSLLVALLLSWMPTVGHAASTADDDEGYREIMARAATDPPDAPVDVQAFTLVHLEILASEITFGADGPRLPVFLNYTPDGSDARMHLFADGKAVEVGQQEDTNFSSSIHGFDLVATCRSHTVSSGSGNCLVLRNGDKLQSFLSRHHIKRPFGHQLAIEQILKPYLTAQGEIVLKDNERITLFELGTMDTASPAYDFQDLVVLLRLGDPKPFRRGDF